MYTWLAFLNVYMIRNYLNCRKFGGKGDTSRESMWFLYSCQKLCFVLSERWTQGLEDLVRPKMTLMVLRAFGMKSHLRLYLGCPGLPGSLSIGRKKHLWCKTALKHWMINRFCMITEEKEQQRKDLQWKNRQLKAAWELKLPGNRRVLNSTSLCLC